MNTTHAEQMELIYSFWGHQKDPAPTSSERKKSILSIFESLKGKQIDDTGNFSFKIGDRDICEAALLNLLGYSASKNASDAPYQWKTFRYALLGKELTSANKDEFKVKQASAKYDTAKTYLNYLSNTFFGDMFADGNGMNERTKVSSRP